MTAVAHSSFHSHPSFSLPLFHVLVSFLSPLLLQQEALLSALCIGERWLDAITVVNKMLQQSTVVDNATAGLAMKAYASIGLKDHWKSVRQRSSA